MTEKSRVIDETAEKAKISEKEAKIWEDRKNDGECL